MRILVTGGAGFIGSHLCRRFVSEGHHVICLDNFFTGSLDNINDLLEKPGFELLVQDVTQEISLDSLDQIYNMACPASPPHYQKDPVKTLKTNVLGALHVLELARRTDARVLQASTSEVYGDPALHPQREDYWGNVNPIGIRSCYDEGKRAAETLFFDYHRQYGVEIKVARIFNTYGPNMQKDDGRVVSNFIVEAIEGQNITIYGNGSQTRSFCYIEDTVEGLVRLMNSDKAIIGPINIGNPSEHTVKELAELIVALTGSKSALIFKPLPEDDPKRRKPDITQAREKLHWSPSVGIHEGLQQTIKYFEGQRLYHDHRITKSIEDSMDFAAKRQV